MTGARVFSAVIVAVTLAGCGSSLTGTYRGDARVMEGREETDNENYSLAAVKKRIAEDGRTITLQSNGRFIWRSGGTTVEGDWHVESNKVIALDDTGNGRVIVPGMRVEREFAIRENGELVLGTSYNHYNLEEFFTKE